MSEYIKREDVLKCLKEASEQIDWGQSGDGDAFKHYIGAVYRTIASSDCVPSADVVERKRGEWIAVDSYSAFGGSEEQWYAHGNPTAYHYCSNCKEQAYADEFGKDILSNFCPNCGARMKGADDE